jgi:hypothetical protein
MARCGTPKTLKHWWAIMALSGCLCLTQTATAQSPPATPSAASTVQSTANPSAASKACVDAKGDSGYARDQPGVAASKPCEPGMSVFEMAGYGFSALLGLGVAGFLALGSFLLVVHRKQLKR